MTDCSHRYNRQGHSDYAEDSAEAADAGISAAVHNFCPQVTSAVRGSGTPLKYNRMSGFEPSSPQYSPGPTPRGAGWLDQQEAVARIAEFGAFPLVRADHSVLQEAEKNTTT